MAMLPAMLMYFSSIALQLALSATSNFFFSLFFGFLFTLVQSSTDLLVRSLGRRVRRILTSLNLIYITRVIFIFCLQVR